MSEQKEPRKSQTTITLSEWDWQIIRDAVKEYGPDAPRMQGMASNLHHRLQRANDFHVVTLTRNRDD